ncbi:MAG TPA: hypothetical protein VKD72_32895 [Gemmataceae bacterium]|nr:hypothetical protein [Gemmataceae bacterium]
MEKATKSVEIPVELRPVVAAAAKNLAYHLYGPEGPPWGTSFASLEELATLLGRQFGAELLQQALQRQAAQPAPAELNCCPCCSGPLVERPPEPRSVRTDTGLADWKEPARHCPRCRRAFFPPEQEPGHRPD